MAAKDIEAGRAHVVLRLQDLMSQGLDRVERRLFAFGKGVALAGGGLLGMGTGAAAAIGGIGSAIFGAAKSFADAGSKLDDMSQRTGIAGSSLSALSYAAQLSGTDIDAVEKSVSKMQKVLAEAAHGSTSATEALGYLGVKISDLKGMNVEQQFATLANAIAKIDEPTLRNATAMAVFGKSATDIVPMISGDIDNLIDEAHNLGVVMSNEDVAAAAQLGDSFDKIGVVFSSVTNMIGAAVAGPLSDIIERVVVIVGVVNRWLNANRGLVRVLAYILAIGGAVAAAIASLGAILIGVGGSIALAGMALGAIPAVFGAIASVIGFIFSPMGALVAILIGLASTAFYFRAALWEAFQGLLVWMQPVIDAFWRIWESASGAVNGIVSALSSGNIQLAGEIALGALLAMFWQAAAEIPGIGSFLSTGFGQALLAGRWDLIVGIAMTKAKLWVSDTAAGIGAIWDMLVYGIRTGWNMASTFIASAMLKAFAAVNSAIVGLQIMFDGLVTGAKIAAVAIKGFFTGNLEGAKAEGAKLTAEFAERSKKAAAGAISYDQQLQQTLAEDSARTQKGIRGDFEKSFMARATQGQQLRDQLASLEGQARTAATDAGVTNAEQAAVAARKRLQAAIAKANEGKKGGSEEPPKVTMDLPTFAGSQVLPKVESRGTFSAAAAMAFGGGSSGIDQVATNTRNSNRILKEIRDKKGAAFA